MSRRGPNLCAIVSVLVALAGLLVLSPVARAQETFGPPKPTPEASAPALPSTASILSSLANAQPSSLDSVNPLAALARAGEALQGSGGASMPPSSGGPTTAGQASASRGLSTAINIVLVLTVITLAPSIILMTTCFLRIVLVLGLLKQALGTQQMPPSQVMLGLALIMTLAVMSPTIDRIHREAVVPYEAGQISDYSTLWDRAKEPMRDFMFDQIEATGNWSSLYMVLNYRGIDTSAPERLTRGSVDMISLVPAFVLSELKVGFLMGFKVYLPFLVIDMVISSLLISMSMMMLPPVLISLPFKLLLFVLVDGWQLIAGSLMTSFVTHPVPPPATSPAVSALDVVANALALHGGDASVLVACWT